MHSLKDLPTRQRRRAHASRRSWNAPIRATRWSRRPGPALAGLPCRGAHRHLVARADARKLLARRPDRSAMLDVRGNVPTRLAKLDRGELRRHSILAPAPGCSGSDSESRVAEIIEPEVVHARAGRARSPSRRAPTTTWLLGLLQALDHRRRSLATDGRTRLPRADWTAGCQAPVGRTRAAWSGDVLTPAASGGRSRADRPSSMRERLETRVRHGCGRRKPRGVDARRSRRCGQGASAP
ncbi:MAG: hypothetical protein MZU95_14580 [Desulfomicrobium escambiense]|nr:hypothetical protein [Desulfomicrobium escambiense]